MTEQQLHDRVTRLEVLLEGQEKADGRQESEMGALELKINACFKKVDALILKLAELEPKVDSIAKYLNGKKNRNWALVSIVAAQCLAWVGTLIFGG